MHAIQLTFNLLPAIFTILLIYLDLNRLYPVRDEKSVSDSISVMASIALFFALLPFAYRFFNSANYLIWLTFFLIEAQLLFKVAVGVGFWLKGYRKMSVLKMVKRSLVEEWNLISCSPLLNLNRTANPYIIDLMVHLALIDGDIDDVEMDYLEKSDEKVKRENLQSLIEDRKQFSRANLFESFHKTLHLFLSEKPSQRELMVVSDAIHQLVPRYRELDENEKILLKAIEQKSVNSLEGKQKNQLFDLYLVIQNEEQQKISEAIFDCKQKSFKLDHFYTKSYALKAAKKYRGMKLPVFIVKRID